MNHRKLIILLLDIRKPHVAVVNLDASEIVLIVLSLLFYVGIFGGIIWLIYYLVRRSDLKQKIILPSSVAINFTAPNHSSNPVNVNPEKRNTVYQNLNKQKVALPQQHEIRYIDVEEIIRCEADDNYTNFYLSGGEKILISKSLKEYSDLLIPSGFIRCHQSHLVNPLFIKSWLKEDGGILLLASGEKIPVSKPNRESVKLLLGNASKFYP